MSGKKGSKHGNCIEHFLKNKYPEKSTPELAQEYGVCKQTICNALNGTTFVNASHVNEYYEPVNKPIRVIL